MTKNWHTHAYWLSCTWVKQKGSCTWAMRAITNTVIDKMSFMKTMKNALCKVNALVLLKRLYKYERQWIDAGKNCPSLWKWSWIQANEKRYDKVNMSGKMQPKLSEKSKCQWWSWALPYRMKKPSRKIYRYFLVECHHGIQEKGLLSHRCRSCFMFMLQKVEMEGRTYRWKNMVRNLSLWYWSSRWSF